MGTGPAPLFPDRVRKLDWQVGELARQVRKLLGERQMRQEDIKTVIAVVMKYRDDYCRDSHELEALLALASESPFTLKDFNYGVLATPHFLRVPDSSRLPIRGYLKHLATVVLIAEVWTRLAYEGVYIEQPHSGELMRVWAERRAELLARGGE